MEKTAELGLVGDCGGVIWRRLELVDTGVAVDNSVYSLKNGVFCATI